MFRSRRLVVFVGVVLVGAMLQASGMARFLSLSAGTYFAMVFILAAVAARFAPPTPRQRWEEEELEESWPGSASEFLCDTCRYNDVRDCHRTERPNATSCDDYARR
jgi:hypothetical protein